LQELDARRGEKKKEGRIRTLLNKGKKKEKKKGLEPLIDAWEEEGHARSQARLQKGEKTFHTFNPPVEREKRKKKKKGIRASLEKSD